MPELDTAWQKRLYVIMNLQLRSLLVLTSLCSILAPLTASAQRALGIDVSDYQGTITWSSVAGSGVVFAWSKATEGTSGTQSTFINNQNNGKAAGIYMGAYHYSHPELNTPLAEATFFWSKAGPYMLGDGKTLMPMLDVEGSALPNGHTGAASLSDWVNQWCSNVVRFAAVSNGVIIKPCIYVSAGTGACDMDNSVGQWNCDIANYGSVNGGNNPQTGTPWSCCTSCEHWGTGTSAWNFWQYESVGTIPGISGNVDHDVFNGDATTLFNTMVAPGDASLVTGSTVPLGVQPGQTFTAVISLKNTGTTTWTNTGANAYKLGSQNPQDNFTWGTNRVPLPTSPVAPGQTVTFNFPVTAPATAGSYTFAWKMVQEGVQWFGATFSQTVNVGNGASVVSVSVPATVTNNQIFTATITMKNTGGSVWTNTGVNPYRLGSQSPQDNTTWGTNRAWLSTSPVNLSNNVTFTFTATAPATVGTYAFAWKMLQEPSSYFGATFTTNIVVAFPGPGITMASYTVDTNMDSTSRNASYANNVLCGFTNWYSFGVPHPTASCTVFNRDIRYIPNMPQYGFTGRGYLFASMNVPSSSATATVKFFAVDSGGADLAGPITGTINECAYSCSSPTFYNGAVNVTSFGGWRSNTQDDTIPTGSCSTNCGTFPAAYSQMHLQAARWQYINDWACLGGYSSSSVSDTSNRSFSEANLYLYPALDTSHGNNIATALGYNGKTPGRVTTGDCNSANSLDFKGNAAAFGNGDGMDAYGFAWMFSPTGAVPKFVIGSDDGNRLWINGVLKNDTNASRALTRDMDQTAAVSLPAGWSRLLFKVHNVSGPFQGTVSLRNGTNSNLNAPFMNAFDFGGYYSYGVSYEQDAWYPKILVTNVYGVSTPANGSALYGSNTTVSAAGTSSGQGPVPYNRTMQYQWGFDLGGAETDYADVTGTPTSASWSHSMTNVAGHRRIYLFAVSQSGRTSFQNNGISGGSLFQDAGNYGRYYDIFVDNLPPLDPAFTSVICTNTSQVNLAWSIPLDQGANTPPGSTESAGASGPDDSQNWYRVGDPAVQVYRNGTVISAWGGSSAITDSGLNPNTPYNYTIEARDNNSEARGTWHNSTGPEGTNIVWTLSIPPGALSVVPDQTNVYVSSNVNWSAVAPFGPGNVQYYRYTWDQSPTYTFNDSEPQWSAGTIATSPSAPGTWYLHVKGYNGADVGNGTFDYAISVTQPPAQAPQLLSIVNSNNTVWLTWSSVSGAIYRVQYTPDLSGVDWSNLIPDIQATNSTASISDDAGTDSQRYYRVMLLP